jgi:hypothetical protein
MSYLDKANSFSLYLIVGIILTFVAFVCVVFIIKSYKAGLRLGMDKKVLRKAITSSASFTLLPSVSILLGVIALSGSLGVPISWLRLSVIGNLQYEATVANIVAEQMGTKLDSSLLTLNSLVTIMLTMTIGIIWGGLLSIFTLKPYSKKLRTITTKNTDTSTKKSSFAPWAMTAMMIGLCSTFIGSYMATGIVKGNYTPIISACVSALFMVLFERLSKIKVLAFLDSFALALSMLMGMCTAIVLELL